MDNKGVSIVTVIITIVTMLIIASISLYSAFSVPERASFAGFVEGIDNITVEVRIYKIRQF